MDVLRAEAHPTEAEWKIVHRSVDEAMAEAATAFVLKCTTASAKCSRPR